MMTVTYKGIPVNLAHHLRKTVTAHVKVREGIATHAEKERAAREARDAKTKADAAILHPVR